MGLPIKTTVQQPQDQLYFNKKTPEFYITTSHNAKLKAVSRLLLDLDVRVVFMGFFLILTLSWKTKAVLLVHIQIALEIKVYA